MLTLINVYFIFFLKSLSTLFFGTPGTSVQPYPSTSTSRSSALELHNNFSHFSLSIFQGSVVIAEIQGHIEACIKLSGMPDLTMSFVNHRLLDDVSFHPCVRYKRWEVS